MKNPFSVDPYGKYGEAKPVKKDPYGYTSTYDVAPDYNQVKKSLRLKKLMWQVPTGIAVVGAIWLTVLYGGPFLIGAMWALLGIAACTVVVYGISKLIDAGIEADSILAKAKEHGVAEPVLDKETDG